MFLHGYWKGQCLNVIDELNWLLEIIERFSLFEYYPKRAIEDTEISKSNRLLRGLYDKDLCDKEDLRKPLANYEKLNVAIVERMDWVISKAMSKERVVEKVVVKKVGKSIDMNTWVTAILDTFGISATLLAA